MKRNDWTRTTDRLWCLLFVFAVTGVTTSGSKTVDQIALSIPTKESLPQLAEALKAVTYTEADDELEKNFDGNRNTYKRSARKLQGNDDLDKISEPLQEYQGVMGRPGVDFPILTSIPHTDFSCKKVKKPGYYADPETDCQVFHICDNGRKISFLCPNGTIFRQSHLICDWWFRVDCERSIELYEESAEQLATDQRIFKERAAALAKSMLKVQTTSEKINRVVTERPSGPSTTIFNSESRLPERARYFNSYESQVPAGTSSFVKNQFSTNYNDYNQQSKTHVKNWNQFNSQLGNNYQNQASTTAQPTWNQGHYHPGNNYQTQSSTIAQPTWNQGGYHPSNNYQTQSSTTAQPIWNQDNYQPGNNYQAQSSTIAQPTLNQGEYQPDNNYQIQSSTIAQPTLNQSENRPSNNYQTQSSTAAQPTWNQGVKNNIYQSDSYPIRSTTTSQSSDIQDVGKFQSSSYQPQYTTPSDYSISNQGVTRGSQVIYNPQPNTVTTQSNWNVGSQNYQGGNYQTMSATAAIQTNRNNQGDNKPKTDNYQYYTPPTIQTNWNQGSISYSQAVNYQTPSTTEPIQSKWNNQGASSFQTENYQTSPTTTPTPSIWVNQNANNFGTENLQKHATTIVPQTDNWIQAGNNLQSSNYQSQPGTTVQPDWNQESETNQPGQYQTQQSYQQPTTILPTEEKEQTVVAKESQVPAESASFIGYQNSPRFNYQPEHYYTQSTQTDPPQTTYPVVTNTHSNNYSPSGAFSFTNYQRSPNTPVTKDTSTEISPTMTTVLDYTTVNNSTLPPSGETLIPNMINSLQTLSDNNLLFDLDGQNAYPSQTNADDDLNSIALYFNNVGNHQLTTVASDLQFNYYEQTSQAYANAASSTDTKSAETTARITDSLLIPAVLTQNTKEAYDKLFKNNTKTDSMAMVRSASTTSATTVQPKSTLNPTSNPTSNATPNLRFAQELNLNRSSAELRELAAVFTRALTAYLDDPENFRKILAEVRPTEPPIAKTSIAEEQEVLDFSDDTKRHRNKPTVKSTSSSTSLAHEINGMPHNVNALADLSTTVPQYTTSPLIEITSKFSETQKPEIQEYPPLVDSEQLQVAGTQSFYSRKENSIETTKTVKPATSTLTWTVSPSMDIESEVRTTTQSPIYFTTTAENLETTMIVQRAKEMLSHLNASDAGILMNVMKTAQNNDTVRRLVLLLVNDPNKENSPEQTRNNIIEALLDDGDASAAVAAADQTRDYGPASSVEATATAPGIPFGQRLQEDGSAVTDGSQRKKFRKSTRRRVVHRSRSVFATSTTPTTTANIAWSRGVDNDVGPGLSSDSDARAVELLKSLYSIASKWS